MSVRINIQPDMQQLANGQDVVEVVGNTVGECLDLLVKQFPDMGPELFAKNGKLQDYIDIFVNKESSYPEELMKPVKDGDELHILWVISGG